MRNSICHFLRMSAVFALVLATSVFAEEKYVPLWKFDVIGAASLVGKFDSELINYKLIEKKECFRFDRETEGHDKRGGLAFFCLRKEPTLGIFTTVFSKTTPPSTEDAEVVPLEMQIKSLSVPQSSLTCSDIKCNTHPLKSCVEGYVGGSLTCKHIAHACQ